MSCMCKDIVLEICIQHNAVQLSQTMKVFEAFQDKVACHPFCERNVKYNATAYCARVKKSNRKITETGNEIQSNCYVCMCLYRHAYHETVLKIMQSVMFLFNRVSQLSLQILKKLRRFLFWIYSRV